MIGHIIGFFFTVIVCFYCGYTQDYDNLELLNYSNLCNLIKIHLCIIIPIRMICGGIVSDILNWIEFSIGIWFVVLISPVLKILTHHSWMIDMSNDVLENIELNINLDINNSKNSEQP